MEEPVPPLAPHRLAAPLALLAALVAPALASAQPVTDYETPRNAAMGTGGAASARSASAAALGSAALPWLRAYHVETAAGFDLGGSGWWVGGTVSDSITNRLAAALSVRGVFGLGEADHGGYDSRLALALPLSEAVSLGFSARYVNLVPEQEAEGIDPGTHGVTLDASLGVRPDDQLAFLLFGRNLLDRGTALLPRQLGGSASATFEEAFTIALDGWAEWTPSGAVRPVLGGGLEYFAGGQVPLRLGYRFDGPRQAHFLSGGIGYVEKRVLVDLALRQGVSGASGTELLLAFRYQVQ